MATKNLKEIKGMSQEELTTKSREIEAGLFQAKMKKATGQLADTASVWRLRKTLARIKTLQTQAKGK